MVDIYSHNARTYFDRYRKLSFADVHGHWLDQLPPQPGFALDVGAGSGRDAAGLAERGWEVLAAEPSEGLRSLAEEATGEAGVHWIDDRLPDMPKVRSLSYRFNLILVSAVWNHLPASQRERAFRILAELLAPGGILVITLRHGPSDDERSFHEASAEEIRSFARNRALISTSVETPEDLQGRRGVSWETLVFSLPDDGTGTLPLLRHIVVNDNKSSTYKLGLLRAVTKIADRSPGMALNRTDDWVEVPLGLVGLYWIRLYQPLILQHRLRQSPGNAGYGFAKEPFYALRDVSTRDLSVGKRIGADLGATVLAAIRDACRSISVMPAHYTTYPGTGRQVFEVDPGRISIRSGPITLDREVLSRFGTLRIPTQLWDCLSRYACWLEPAIINEWASLMQGYEVRYDEAVHMRALQWAEDRRETALVRALVANRVDHGHEVPCVWTNRRLTPESYAIDHCFPWSRWSNNDLWNLMPATMRANGAKGEKLPSATLLNDARERIEEWWTEAFIGTERENQFFIEAEAALPLARHGRGVETVFEGVAHQRFRLRMNQQLVEWFGLK